MVICAVLLGLNTCIVEQERPSYLNQDNAPSHKAHPVIKWFDENEVRVVAWLSESPDLSSIEKFVADVEGKCAEIHHCI
ncbi:hypothetical protein Trydic_g19332 [Trypoxylus dichotomus]